MKLNSYTFQVQHDNGMVNLSTVARSIDSAIEIISNAEQCPKSALILLSISKNITS